MSKNMGMITVVVLSLGLMGGCHRPEAKTTAQPHGAAAVAEGVTTTEVHGTATDSTEIRELEARVAASRAAYYTHLLTLRDFYTAHGLEAKRKWAQFELDELRRVKTYDYGGTVQAAK